MHQSGRSGWRNGRGLFVLVCLVASSSVAAPPNPRVRNTQDPADVPISPAEQVARMTVPPGFQVTLFAAEPDVRQPIALDIDDRGRLWVAECYTYEGGQYDHQYDDRVLIFEDVDGDGRFDNRKVFWQGPGPLTGLTVGFDGLWMLCGGQLRLLYDRDRDDRPDGEPVVLLDGWDIERTRHNVVNGLCWGPDGWLYGRHGITYSSLVGPPGSVPEERTLVHCSIWRFHPTRHVLEVVCNGTTNPWGLDWDDHGEAFFTNNVNGHLWHVVPGAHFLRMYGEDPNPYVYELMTKCADHDHWDSSAGSWQVSRGGQGRHGQLGGGHSHCGAMIYLGDNWPDRYRNTIFMCNTHGHRVNNDRLEQLSCGYAGRHWPDFLMAHSDWFRGVELKYGPDGGVLLIDWTDLGECHDHDGEHRTSGRIYKITYGRPARAGQPVDVAALPAERLVQLQLHKNDWFVRHSRRVLQERAAAGVDLSAAADQLHRIFATHPDVTRRLRALWALYSIGAIDDRWLLQQLDDPDEHVRAWCIRLLVDDGQLPAGAVDRLADMARSDPSGLVQLYLASAAQRLAPARRWRLLETLDSRQEWLEERNLTLLIWYALEPAVALQPERAVAFALAARRPLLRQLVARRLGEQLDGQPEPVDQLLSQTVHRGDEQLAADVLEGLAAALQGRLSAPRPDCWPAVQRAWGSANRPTLRQRVVELSALFGDGRTLDQLRRVAADPAAPPASRRHALEVLLRRGDQALLPLLRKLANDRATQAVAVRGLAAYNDPVTLRNLLGKFAWLERPARQSLLDTACSRPTYAVELLRAVGQGKVPKQEISAWHVRQLSSLNDPQVQTLIRQVWGSLRDTPEEKRRLIQRYKALLTPQRLQRADRSHGRQLFEQTCAKCHKLYGVGESVGPDLTGANRQNLDYLLENLVDPSALIPKGYEMWVIALDDGRILNGIIVRQGPKTILLRTQNDQQWIDRDQIDEMKKSTLSLMPEGQLDQLSEQDIVDLIAYLSGTAAGAGSTPEPVSAVGQ